MRSVALATLCLMIACGPATPTGPTRAPYYLVGPHGAVSYPDPMSAARPGRQQDPPARARRLLPGFGVAIVEQRHHGHRRLGRTAQGRWIDLGDLEPAPGAAAPGVPVDGTMNFAWVVNDDSPVARRPGGRPTHSLGKHTRVILRDRCANDSPWCHTAVGWLRGTDLRAPTSSPRPAGVHADELWIDVDRRTNTLVAHRGDRPVFATLISTGTGRPGTRFATPPGTFRIRAKARTATMDNLEHTGVVPYSYEDIPDVQYFGSGVALHAAFWHQRFGHPMSHGCVNMAPADAARLFAMTAPVVPDGERQAQAGGDRPGTLVRVR